MGKFVVVCFFFCRVYYVNSCNSNKSKGKLKAMWGGGGGGGKALFSLLST